MSNDFSNWSREDLARWLHVNYPAPPGLLTDTSWVFGLRIYIAKEASIDSYSSKVGYEACLDSLAESLASFARDGTLSTEPTERLEITPSRSQTVVVAKRAARSSAWLLKA